MQLFSLDFITFRSFLLSFEIVSKILTLFIKRRNQLDEREVCRKNLLFHLIMNDLYLFVFSIRLHLLVSAGEHAR